MVVDPLTVSILSLAVTLVVLVFGPGIGIRGLDAVRAYLRTRAEQKRELSEYLKHSAIFLEGLPHFISHTWAWGPSVPNYAAGGSFPPETTLVSKSMPSVCAAVRDSVALYVRHSQTQGLPAPSKEETLSQLKEIELEFWQSVELFAKSRWPLRWRVKICQLGALHIPTGEYDRIRRLKESKGHRSVA